MKKFLLLSMALFIAMGSIVQAEVQTLYPTYDTYTSGLNPGCYGTDNKILTGNYTADGHDEQGLFYFDLTALSGATVTNATFHILAFSGCSNHPSDMDFRHATVAWDETLEGGHISSSDEIWANHGFSTTEWHEIDLTTLFQAWADGDMPNYGFVMSPNEISGDYRFRSKDATNEELRPYIVIDFEPEQPPEKTCPIVDMPQTYFTAGDTFYCNVDVWNVEAQTLTGYPLLVVLDVYNSFFFAPSFNQTYDSFLTTHPEFEPGKTVVEVMPAFEWPADVGAADNIIWWSALLTPDMTAVFGDINNMSFGWGE